MRKTTIPRIVIVDPYPQRAVDIFVSELGIPIKSVRVMAQALDSDSSISDLLGPP
jgi:hypothetical protein